MAEQGKSAFPNILVTTAIKQHLLLLHYIMFSISFLFRGLWLPYCNSYLNKLILNYSIVSILLIMYIFADLILLYQILDVILNLF